MKKVSMEWRFAYPDCRELVSLVEDNAENYDGIFDSKRAGYMVVVDMAISTVLLITALFWNAFSEPKITPQLFLLVVAGAILASLVVYFVYCIYNMQEIKSAKRQITAYQAVWPAILDVVAENKNNFLLPSEPLRADDIEVVAGIAIDDSFINGAKVSKNMPRVTEAEIVPIPITTKNLRITEQATGVDVEELYKDPTVARLLDSETDEVPRARKTKADLIGDWYQKRMAGWSLDDEKKEQNERGEFAV